ncbi:MAG: GntR family transcriptional regulator [Clostridiales bacterium]|jgi:GntR family transcriptional repressor for pyruvate dehydrogenase complex|nr:GntR family transcriptional regulator [Clostridiales bacterium]
MATPKKNQLNRDSLVDQVSDILKQQILDGRWKTGEPLPSEKQLAETFGVNRLTIRVALKKLNAMCLINTKAGEGTFVREFDLQEYMDVIGEFYQTVDMIQDISGFRKLLEKEWIRLAIENYNPKEVEKLAAIVEECRKAAEGRNIHTVMDVIDHLTDVELKYLSQLARMSGNSIYPILLVVVSNLVKRHTASIYQRILDGEIISDFHDKDGNFIPDQMFPNKILCCFYDKDWRRAWELYDKLQF